MKNVPAKASSKKALRRKKKEIRAAANAVDIKSLPKSRIVTSIFTSDTPIRKSIPFGAFFAVCAFTFAAIFIVFMAARVNDVSREIATMKQELADVRYETSNLKAKLMQKKDMSDIRKRAEDLGMVRVENLPSHYLSVQLDDKITLYPEETHEFTLNFVGLLSAVKMSANDFLQFISNAEQ